MLLTLLRRTGKPPFPPPIKILWSKMLIAQLLRNPSLHSSDAEYMQDEELVIQTGFSSLLTQSHPVLLKQQTSRPSVLNGEMSQPPRALPVPSQVILKGGSGAADVIKIQSSTTGV